MATDYIDRALLVLTREARRAREASERVDLVVQALAIRARKVTQEPAQPVQDVD